MVTETYVRKQESITGLPAPVLRRPVPTDAISAEREMKTVTTPLKSSVHLEAAMAYIRLAQVDGKLREHRSGLDSRAGVIDIMRKTGNGPLPLTRMFLEVFADNLEQTGNRRSATRVRDEIAGVDWERPR